MVFRRIFWSVFSFSAKRGPLRAAGPSPHSKINAARRRPAGLSSKRAHSQTVCAAPVFCSPVAHPHPARATRVPIPSQPPPRARVVDRWRFVLSLSLFSLSESRSTTRPRARGHGHRDAGRGAHVAGQVPDQAFQGHGGRFSRYSSGSSGRGRSLLSSPCCCSGGRRARRAKVLLGAAQPGPDRRGHDARQQGGRDRPHGAARGA